MSIGQLEPRAGGLERGYLSGTFGELCRIEGGSGRGRRCAERVIAELRALGVGVSELSEPPLSDCGCDCDCVSLLARIPATPQVRTSGDVPCVLLCAHLDTPPLHAPPRPVLIEGCWTGEDGVLGAGNKAAVAVLLALARYVCNGGPPVDVELLFTAHRHAGLAGVGALNASALQSRLGFVFDDAAPLGGLVVASPALFRLEASFRGTPLGAIRRREDSRSAILAAARAIASMRLGRLDGETTAHVETISGGDALDAAAHECSLIAEVGSASPEKAEAVVGELIDRVYEAANTPDCECDVDVGVQHSLAGYRLPPGGPAVRAAERALRACGHEPEQLCAGEASHANALIEQGLEIVNLANGLEPRPAAVDGAGERVSVAALEAMLDLALALLDECLAAPAPRSR